MFSGSLKKVGGEGNRDWESRTQDKLQNSIWIYKSRCMEGQRPLERLDIYHCRRDGSEKCGAPQLHSPDHIPTENGRVCDIVGKTVVFVSQQLTKHPEFSKADIKKWLTSGRFLSKPWDMYSWLAFLGGRSGSLYNIMCIMLCFVWIGCTKILINRCHHLFVESPHLSGRSKLLVGELLPSLTKEMNDVCCGQGGAWEVQRQWGCPLLLGRPGWKVPRSCDMVRSFSSVQFSRSVVSNSLWPHGLQHARPPCPSPTPGVYPNLCPLSQWCHPIISFSVVPFSSHLQSFQASGSFQMSQLFPSSGQSIGISASTSVLPMNTQDWSPLGWTGWISLQS